MFMLIIVTPRRAVPILYFPITMSEEMVGTTANTSTSTFPIGFSEEMVGTVSNTATIPFPIDVSD